MILLDYIDLKSSEPPIITDITLNDVLYKLEFKYNERGDFYTGIIYDYYTDDVLYSGKFIYANSFIHVVSSVLPMTDKLVPFDFNDLFRSTVPTSELNKSTFNNPVEIYILPDGLIEDV